MPITWTGATYQKPGDKGRLGPGRMVRDMTAALRAGQQLGSVPNQGTMGARGIQDAAGTYLFMCGRSKCGGPDVCGD